MEFYSIPLLLAIFALLALRYDRISNWIWLAWGCITLLVFIVALDDFSGPFVDDSHLSPSLRHYIWSWWKAWIIFFLGWLVLAPFCFWDDIRDAWKRVKRRQDERTVVLNNDPTLAKSEPSSDLERAVELFRMIFAADFPSQLVREVLKTVIPRMFKARKR
jgi:type VI protein secretion system component VasK